MPQTAYNGGTAGRLVDSLWDFWRKWRLASHPVVKGRITPEQYWLMRRLKRCGPLTVSNLASGINITTGSATTATKRLEKMAFVHRDRQQEDQRVVLVSLTAEGDSATERWREEQRKALLDLVSRISEDEQETLLEILEKILEQGE
jgi:DNA-binding MarR family transcriptional regulator